MKRPGCSISEILFSTKMTRRPRLSEVVAAMNHLETCLSCREQDIDMRSDDQRNLTPERRRQPKHPRPIFTKAKFAAMPVATDVQKRAARARRLDINVLEPTTPENAIAIQLRLAPVRVI